MTVRLQVRQIRISDAEDFVTVKATKLVVEYGSWHNVRSPGWLIGFVLPGPGLAYEFRNAPEEDQ